MHGLEALLAEQPPPMDFVYLGGRGSSHCALYLDLRDEDVTEFSAYSLTAVLEELRQDQSTSPGAPVYLGLLSYDDFARGHLTGYKDDLPLSSKLKKSMSHILAQGHELKLMGQPSPAAAGYFARIIEYQRVGNHAQTGEPGETLFHLKDRQSKQAYLRKVAAIKADIRKGRYYQLNLLRRFVMSQLPRQIRLRDDPRVWRLLIQRFQQCADAMSAMICIGDELILSFSPERFITIQPALSGRDGYAIHTFPIKGTIARSACPQQDKLNRQWLMNSAKDIRELNMIVDLMRNDIAQVAISGSTSVVDAGKLIACQSVFHRRGHIRAELQPTLSWEQLWQRLLPAGSITGAPKVEVVGAIREYEAQPRGYFMGHLVVMDHRGLDSSVLIRTMVHSPERGAEYAAGSGLVYDSSGEHEYLETTAKCAMWT